MKEQLLRIFRPLKNFLFRIVNREFLIFLFFLLISGAFWLLTTLNEIDEYEYKIPVNMTGVPRDVIITTSFEDTLHVTLRDRGFTLAAYLFGNRIKPVVLNFQTYATKGVGRGIVPPGELQKLVYRNLYGSSKIVTVKPERLDFYYNFGQSQKVPVRLNGTITPAKSYYLARTISSPSSVTIYADRDLLDSIKHIYTEPLKITNFEDTVVQTVNLQKIKGVKIVPEQVVITLCPDVLTEESIEVPIHAVNMPEGNILRTFPPRVKVKFVAGATLFRQIKPEQFLVEADFRELVDKHPEKCPLYLRKIPSGVKNAQLEITQVDYLIEQ
ncbi:MAG: YbbR-like domain-containing protein [Prevotella sp.]|nr:YbbR-like domain-containing protein [Prevotella sp.]